MAGKLFLISAPSGAGKTTLVNALIERYACVYNLERVITYTSKEPREGERCGVDYHFISTDDFEKKINTDFFLEWSCAYQAYYGSPREVLGALHAAKSYILIVDRVGAEQILNVEPQAVSIWIYTSNISDLHKRIVCRASDGRESILHRLDRARQEISCEICQPICKYHILNQDFELAFGRLLQIIKREIS